MKKDLDLIVANGHTNVVLSTWTEVIINRSIIPVVFSENAPSDVTTWDAGEDRPVCLYIANKKVLNPYIFDLSKVVPKQYVIYEGDTRKNNFLSFHCGLDITEDGKWWFGQNRRIYENFDEIAKIMDQQFSAWTISIEDQQTHETRE